MKSRSFVLAALACAVLSTATARAIARVSETHTWPADPAPCDAGHTLQQCIDSARGSFKSGICNVAILLDNETVALGSDENDGQGRGFELGTPAPVAINASGSVAYAVRFFIEVGHVPARIFVDQTQICDEDTPTPATSVRGRDSPTPASLIVRAEPSTGSATPARRSPRPNLTPRCSPQPRGALVACVAGSAACPRHARLGEINA